ncbi:MAG: hemolysin III family protein [Acidimicrobiales bacterium]
MDQPDFQPVIPPGVSPSIERMLSRPRPRWRGVIHRVAVPCSLVAGAITVAYAPAGSDRFGAAVYAFGASLMFIASALVHLKHWPIPLWERLFRFDHAAIFVLIASGATPVAITALSGRSQALMLWAVWIGAAVGVGLRLLPFHPPKGLMNTLFLVLGWVPILVATDLYHALSLTVLVLIGVEAVLYSAGALMLGARWPNPSPHIFGYHEIWHVLVTCAVAVHYVVVVLITNA